MGQNTWIDKLFAKIYTNNFVNAGVNWERTHACINSWTWQVIFFGGAK